MSTLQQFSRRLLSRCTAAPLLLLALVAAGCAQIDAREAGRAWQRNNCLHQPSPDMQRECEQGLREARPAPERSGASR